MLAKPTSLKSTQNERTIRKVFKLSMNNMVMNLKSPVNRRICNNKRRKLAFSPQPVSARLQQ